MIFVTVGSQKFQFNRLLKKIDLLVETKKIKEEVIAQIGVSDYKPKNYRFFKFINQDEFKKIIDKCDLVITHAGTGIIITSLKKNKKVVAIPRLLEYGEHVDNHQIQLIKEFSELNLIEPVYKIEDLEKAINTVRKKEYTRYLSNTDVIIEDIKKYISE